MKDTTIRKDTTSRTSLKVYNYKEREKVRKDFRECFINTRRITSMLCEKF